MLSARVDGTSSVDESVTSQFFSVDTGYKMKLKSEFDAVKNNGRRVMARYFIALVSERAFGTSLKCGIICSRKFDKRAVRRNRARRLIWEAFRLIKDQIHPCGIILIPKREILNVKMQDVQIAVRNALNKSGVMER